jgi:hypothetical protein
VVPRATAVSVANYRRIARNKARKYGLDQRIFVRQINAESGFNPRARSPAGAQGIAQIMPATARGWGVDPSKPRQALDAAAKNMAGYVRRYGSYENALRAYNAGPGAIERSKGYAETNAYVAKILGGKDPKRLSRRRVAPGGNGSSFRPASVSLGRESVFDQAGFENAQRRAVLAQFLTKQGRGNSVLFRSGLLSTQAPDPTDFTNSRLVSSLRNAKISTDPDRAIKKGGRYANATDPGGRLLELFYDPIGGWDRPAGSKKVVNIGAIGGHGGHAHVGADPKLAVQLGKLAQRMGLHVRENPHFDPVDPVHTKGSLHYKRRAIDVSGDRQALTAYVRALQRRFGLR